MWGVWLYGFGGVWGRIDVVIYYFIELLLSDMGFLRFSRLVFMEYIFNMNRKRNNKNMKWLIRELFYKGFV